MRVPAAGDVYPPAEAEPPAPATFAARRAGVEVFLERRGGDAEGPGGVLEGERRGVEGAARPSQPKLLPAFAAEAAASAE